jgi:hypothetical protein
MVSVAGDASAKDINKTNAELRLEARGTKRVAGPFHPGPENFDSLRTRSISRRPE